MCLFCFLTKFIWKHCLISWQLLESVTCEFSSPFQRQWIESHLRPEFEVLQYCFLDVRNILDASWLLLDDRWKLPSPIPPRFAYFLSFFMLSNFTGEQWILLCLRSCDGKFLTSVRFPCILECLFSCLFFVVRVCGGCR